MDMQALTTPEVAEYFDARWALASNECWAWMGTWSANGYGRCKAFGSCGGYAHRLAYEMFNGDVQDVVIHHTCGFRLCVNPAHLEALTQTNHAVHHDVFGDYRESKGLRRSASGATHCAHGHEYTEESTYYDNGVLRCRICKREQWQRWKNRQ